MGYHWGVGEVNFDNPTPLTAKLVDLMKEHPDWGYGRLARGAMCSVSQAKRIKTGFRLDKSAIDSLENIKHRVWNTVPYGTTKRELIIAAHLSHPEWTQSKIANEARCSISHVRLTLRDYPKEPDSAGDIRELRQYYRSIGAMIPRLIEEIQALRKELLDLRTAAK